ncbi:MAG TPA: DUF2764 domain-containing protein [Candidatus Coprenecus stercoravium]|uniref:DUF2764 domain-containing protein n=1 Tax=Candidatus Coprenecus stercoravium TaxID=2840735 RepID=A0A9D2KBF6_9BACT|nr:DUF2764 domain-containing protein [Candidatus Coprenecus stercoravium]
MNNYHYIIAGLPELLPDFSADTFAYQALEDSVREQLSAKDNRTVDWLKFGSDPANLSRHFYRAVASHRSGFLRKYFDLDRKMRNAQAGYTAAEEGLTPDSYTIGETESAKEEMSVLMPIFQNSNLIEREHLLDRFRWDRITDMTVFHYFDMDVILAFLTKGMIVSRWSRMDKERGAELFRQYVDEVRGTFKGVNFN